MASTVQIFLVFCWSLWIAAGAIMHLSLTVRSRLPPILLEALTYGKLRLGIREHFPFLSVPKRWFTHFYAWGTIWNCSLLFLCVTRCVFGVHFNMVDLLLTIDDALVPSRTAMCHTLPGFEVLLVLTLVCCQLLRRLYECLFVSVFSQSKMHVIHYVLGMWFYTALGPSVLVHMIDRDHVADTTPSPRPGTCLWSPLSFCRWYHVAAVLVFLWASWHQWNCHRILARLRKQPYTNVTKSLYGIPRGDWFDHVTCPHYLAEIIIYTAMFVVMEMRNVVWLLVVLFTASTLTLSARQSHQWYKMRFAGYPAHRKIIIPWIF